MLRRETMSASLPIALEPIYKTSRANASVRLYEGALELRSEGNVSIHAEGSIDYAWVPDAKIRYEVKPTAMHSLAAVLHPGSQELVLPSGEAAQCLSLQISDCIRGILNRPLVRGSGSRAVEVFFHLVNCAHVIGPGVQFGGNGGAMAGRLSFVTDGWTIIVDPVRELSDLDADLRSTGGFAITHVGRLMRDDGSEFDLSSADEILHCLLYMLSFAHGRWVAPILSVARDASGATVREDWQNRILSHHQWHMSWFCDMASGTLEELFPKFWDRWRQPLWKDTIRRVVWWYVASNEKAGGLDGAVVLVQVALELLAWVIHVEDGHVLSAKGFEALSAADKLRLLVHWIGVTLQIPSELPSLARFAQERKPKIEFGPWAFTEIRNALVHPKNRMILSGAENPLLDTWCLGMWYLELALLRASDFRGKYTNRLRATYAGEVETVPWV